VTTKMVGVGACRAEGFQYEIPLGALVLTPRRMTLPNEQGMSGKDDDGAMDRS
jgi:hypothetical protein